MINNLSITLCLLCVLSACSSTVVPSKVGPNGEYIGWHCSGDIASEGNWHCEEKVLKDGQVVVVAESAPVANADRQSSNEQLDKHSSPPSDPPSDRQSSPPIIDLTQELSTEPVSVEAVSNYPTSGYSLQLGAYRSRQQAHQAAENMLLTGPVEIRDIISQGKPFSVILLGHYASRSEAELAAQYLTVNYWIRSMRSLVDARAN
ncbi:MAG: SPOR domain-containing protein [Porticoccaceae bacterium]|nr:SPOR domain-containing protein [Porticoccaceae bacterium]